ncbi:angiogenic factor with G patch and FHA domains 1 isoform X3 [Ostrinia furnacalis]|uniref:angiogenic factor with G patch and FHA domains 1 isoform X3 n=1 Tax=Ostrinia furnacalis TaxID=93504 RepID=UPI00103915A1|nr:angiogenic factor with G patch and FHA domains 1 isoform X3 [Ostrinia furnacalis]
MTSEAEKVLPHVKKNNQMNLKNLRVSLRYRPKLVKLILKMRHCIRKKNLLLMKLKERLKVLDKASLQKTDSYCQTESESLSSTIDTNTVGSKSNDSFKSLLKTEESSDVKEESGWDVNKDGEKAMSIADQVKEIAQSALQQSGMVYVESAGMYYDYKTGYYYNSELGLYYHTDTGCYYYYCEEKKNFVFHSYPDRSAVAANAALLAHEKRKAKKHKKDWKKEDDIDNLTKNLAQVSLRVTTALDAVAKHHPPCMRVIVKETSLAKLKVGSLYLVTKDGGTVGREGDHHAIVLRDANVSRNHLDIRYDLASRTYMAMDLGSKNGTILNGMRMSESQVVSKPIEIIHGSILQLGETKLLCHIHPGKDTCGHCEPGLLLETEEKEKKAAYTRTCSVQKQHQLELARLKNKYAPQPKAIEETAYNDRAQARRTKVGSSHHAEKTQSADIDSFITPENKGFKLLEKMGWSKGEGLGKDNQGDTEPIPLVSNEGTAGLGATVAPAPKVTGTLGPATMRLANKTKMLRPPAKAFQNDDDDDDLEE